MQNIPDISAFRQRLKELDEQMNESNFFQDGRRAAEISREHLKLSQLLESYQKLTELQKDIEEHESLLTDYDSDEELKALAEEELPSMRQTFDSLKKAILLSMLPPDPNDSRNTIIEIRAGAGGDEASLFAADLFRMYQRYAEVKRWSVEVLGMSESEAGGFKEISFLINGQKVYKMLKYESGVHRVQRVPVTETNGRIHTSTVTVAVLPEAQEVDLEIDPKELDISVCRASGPGGQGVNTTDSAVQILHKPTGMIVQCADERSQLKNKAKAMKVLRARLLKKKEEETQAKYAADRRSQVGTGDRSERIRTYNFPQSRLTDHRIQLTTHNLQEILDGKVDEVITALQTDDQQERLRELVKSKAS